MSWLDGPDFWLTRFLFERAMGLIYLIAFLVVVNQFRPLCGGRGLLPVQLFLPRVRFRDFPSLFWWRHDDRTLAVAAWAGVALSLLAVTGLSERFGLVVSMLNWFALWALYLSFVNVGQTFYGFGWESILCETGFLAIFLGDAHTAPPVLIIWLLCWVLFRVMFGAGLIKLRGDPCWRDLTCLFYHYETQPMPNPLSWRFHHSPAWVHRAGVLFNHFAELVAPLAVFLPPPICYLGGIIIIFFQATLIASGNLSWLNYLTVALCIPAFNDAFFGTLMPLEAPTGLRGGPIWFDTLVLAVTALVVALSYRPILNMASPRQAMNRTYDPLHLVGTYGAFGGITRQRHEVVIEGTDEPNVTSNTQWQPYLFKGKITDTGARPSVVAPYHLRLDWQMWFAGLTGSYNQHPWLLHMVAKLLAGDRAFLKLLGHNPFPDHPPRYVRAHLYHYRFTTPSEASQTGRCWVGTYLREYLPPLSLEEPMFQQLLKEQGWWEVTVEPERSQ